jgi:hypothetical protein
MTKAVAKIAAAVENPEGDSNAFTTAAAAAMRTMNRTVGGHEPVVRNGAPSPSRMSRERVAVTTASYACRESSTERMRP